MNNIFFFSQKKKKTEMGEPTITFSSYCRYSVFGRYRTVFTHHDVAWTENELKFQANVWDSLGVDIEISTYRRLLRYVMSVTQMTYNWLNCEQNHKCSHGMGIGDDNSQFLVACTRLYNPLCTNLSVGRLVGRSVGPSVTIFFMI